jgi:hypothetical protein
MTMEHLARLIGLGSLVVLALTGTRADTLNLNELLPAIPFPAFATGAAEHPPNTSLGSAFGILALDGNTLAFSIPNSELSGTPTGAHIQGPAAAAAAATVLLQ